MIVLYLLSSSSLSPLACTRIIIEHCLYSPCRDERERKLESEYNQQLEQEKARVAVLEAQVEQMKSGKGTTKPAAMMKGKLVAKLSRKEDSEEPLCSPRQQLIASGPIIKSASSSDLLTTGNRTSSVTRQPANTSTQLSSLYCERLSITDMVSECLRNPSSMANIRCELKADNLTPKIQRKFHYKPTPTSLPAMGNETSPLTRDGVRVGESGSLRSPRNCSVRGVPSDK